MSSHNQPSSANTQFSSLIQSTTKHDTNLGSNAGSGAATLHGNGNNEVRQHFTITTELVDGVKKQRIKCNHCPSFDRVVRTFNATHAATHVQRCKGDTLTDEMRARVLSSTQKGRRERKVNSPAAVMPGASLGKESIPNDSSAALALFQMTQPYQHGQQISKEKWKESKRRLGGSGSGVSGGTIDWGYPMAPCPPPPHHPMAPYPLPHPHYHTMAPYAHRPHPHHRMAPYPLPPHHMAPYTPIPHNSHYLHGHPFIPAQVQGMEYAAMSLQQAEQENEEQQDSFALLDENAEYALNDDRTTYLLSTPADGENLSDRQRYVRSHFIELFLATASDVSSRHSRGAQKLHLNQIGLRCPYCVNVNPRDRAARAVGYPSSISRIYQTVADIQRFHFEKCVAVPPKVLQTYKSLKATKTQGVMSPQSYWESSAREIGLVDANEGVQEMSRVVVW